MAKEKSIVEKTKEYTLSFLKRVKDALLDSFNKVRSGKENFYYMLWFWGVIPALMAIVFLQPRIDRLRFGFLAIFFALCLIMYFAWHIYVIKKTLLVQPEYKAKPKEKQDTKNLSKEQKAEIRKQKNKDLIDKMTLRKAWNSTPFYRIVMLIDFLAILVQMQSIFLRF